MIPPVVALIHSHHTCCYWHTLLRFTSLCSSRLLPSSPLSFLSSFCPFFPNLPFFLLSFWNSLPSSYPPSFLPSLSDSTYCALTHPQTLLSKWWNAFTPTQTATSWWTMPRLLFWGLQICVFTACCCASEQPHKLPHCSSLKPVDFFHLHHNTTTC